MPLYALGSNSMYQLGLGPDIQSTNRPLEHPFFKDKRVLKVAVGKLHALVLCEGNILYTWGINDDCALGRDGDESLPGQVPVTQQIVDICGGVSYSAYLTDRGQVFACGTFKSTSGVFGFDSATKFQAGFRRIASLRNIKRLFGGDNHIVMIDGKGNLWTMGANENFQLGRAHRERLVKRCLDPTQVTSNARRKENFCFVTAAGGAGHTLAVNSDGTCFGWGANFNGQLGTGTVETTEAKAVVLEGVREVACGRFHTVFLGEDGEVHGCGDNTLSQVGVEGPRMVDRPVLVLGGRKVDRVQAGSDFTVAQSGGRLYAWGSNMNGELGFDEMKEDEIRTPREIEFKFGKIIDFCCGADFMLILTE